MTGKMNHAAKHMMIENAEGTTRYEYYTTPVKESNVSDKIAYYQPIIAWHHRLVGGSTYSTQNTTVEAGQKHFKEMLAKGFKVVAKRSFA